MSLIYVASPGFALSKIEDRPTRARSRGFRSGGTSGGSGQVGLGRDEVLERFKDGVLRLPLQVSKNLACCCNSRIRGFNMCMILPSMSSSKLEWSSLMAVLSSSRFGTP
ncbi:hypothetical protein DVH24_025589 [Malus domestica]|uniref:Uncharacterized protein n=1 Tax=Malus domestica TaxID=3750 RepID=A0A498HKP7_MALDO|nr:hypothetical protein DVH24_025589 [Malus domestica]